jgi:cold shock CspA family protein
MAKSNETFNKKEKEKKRKKKLEDKKEKAAERKANSGKGKGLEDMMAYVDENGNITSSKPKSTQPKMIELADVPIATPKKVEDAEDPLKSGVISFYNTSKGFGFIRNAKSGENIFFHVNQLSYPAQENDKVNYLTEKGPKGLIAIKINKVG